MKITKIFNIPASPKKYMLTNLKAVLDYEFKKDFEITWDKECEYLEIRMKKKKD